MIKTAKQQAIEKQKKAIFISPLVTENKVFNKQQIEDFYQMFSMFCDNRRQINVQDLLMSAKVLGFDKNYKIVYDGLSLMADELDGQFISFQKFLTMLTSKIGHNNSEEGRRQVFELIDMQAKQKLTFTDLRNISQSMNFALTDDQLRQMISRVSGKGQRQITWSQFNAFIAKKNEKKNSMFS